MNTISALYKLPWVMSSSEENVYPSEKILLLLLYYFQIQLKLCIGATGASYKCYFDLYIIYFHISMSVFPQEPPVSGSEILWQCRCCIKKWGSGICHFSSTCRFTFEGLKTIQSGVREEKSYFFPPTSESNYLIKIHHSFCPRSSVT